MMKFKCAIACLGMLFSAISNAASVGFNSTPAIISVGSSFSLTLEGTGFADVLDGGGLNFSFDPSILQVNSVVIDPKWEFLPSPGTIDNIAGTVDHIQFNTFANPIIGDFNIAVVNFQAIGAGTSALNLSLDDFNPFAAGGNLVAVAFDTATVQIVPEASTASMLLAGLGLLALARTKKWV